MAGSIRETADTKINQFIETYQALRGDAGERILSRKNFHLKAVHLFADMLTIVDISEADYWRIRLSGTKSCERRGVDKTGRNAQNGFDENELTLRKHLANSLFEHPCALRGITRESYANGTSALVDTIALPMLGEDNQRLVVHYAQPIEEIDHDYQDRPLLTGTGLVSYEFFDLGHGKPATEAPRLRA